MNLSTFLFDFDGTLVDSMPTYISAMLRILDENGISYGSDIVKIITPLGYLGTAKYFHDELGLPTPIEDIVEKMKAYAFIGYRDSIGEKKNVIKTLKALKEKGCSLNILTASPHTVLDVCLKRLGIEELFANIWSSDDFPTTKADPAIYKMAAERLGKPVSEILFVDDNYNADKTAKSAGMKVCGIFDESSRDYVDEIKSVSDYYVYCLDELLTLFK